MKNENVAKINKLGKISRIFINIMRVIVVIGLVIVPIAGAMVMMIPNDSLKATGSGYAQIIVEDNKFLEEIVDLRFEETDLDAKFWGMNIKLLVNEERDADDNRVVSFEGEIKELSVKQIKLMAIISAFAAELFLVCVLIALSYAKKLAIALENCNSPFEEEVLRRMKGFGIALAVWAGIVLLLGGISGIAAVFVVLIVLLFISIFKYGAQLQQESDETL
ncbi:MAG: hypothetical protein IKK47_01935 [Ruminococcus sp.]|nr:hypothetical protein [Ruminococcus sp.]